MVVCWIEGFLRMVEQISGSRVGWLCKEPTVCSTTVSVMESQDWLGCVGLPHQQMRVISGVWRLGGPQRAIGLGPWIEPVVCFRLFAHIQHRMWSIGMTATLRTTIWYRLVCIQEELSSQHCGDGMHQQHPGS